MRVTTVWKMGRRRRRSLLGAVTALIVVGSILAGAPAAQAAGPSARATLINTSGAAIGEVAFTQLANSVSVHVEATGIDPTRFHGFHVHDVGSCTTPSFTSAGGHYNPTSGSHAAHAGDNPPLFARADKTVRSTFRTDAYTVAELLAADVAVIVHAGPDNFANIPADRYTAIAGGPVPDATTLGTGDSGGRIACGVVRSESPTPSNGYWLGDRNGGAFAFGSSRFHGSAAGLRLKAPMVGLAETPSRDGYWFAGADGSVFAYGDARFYGSEAALALNAPPVGITAPGADAVALLVNSSGATIGHVAFTQLNGSVRVHVEAAGIEPARFHGFHVHDVGTCTTPSFTSAGGHFNPMGASHAGHAGDNPSLFARADKTVSATFNTDGYTVQQLLAADVAVVVHAGPDNFANIPADRYSVTAGGTPPDATTLATGDAGGRIACGVVRSVGAGYWTATADGGVFAHGGTGFFGSVASLRLRQPIVGVAATPTGGGYWLVARDGGVFALGDATFYGGAAGLPLNAPIVAILPTPSGRGYVLVAADGGVFTYGDAEFHGSAAGTPLNAPIVAARLSDTGGGYYLAAVDGGVFTYGDAWFRGAAGGLAGAPVIGFAAGPG
jgi:Cu/Zn superoxide dismutase